MNSDAVEKQPKFVLSAMSEIAPNTAANSLPGGLTSEEARRRLAEFGPNATPDAAPAILRRVAGAFWAPVPWMLEAAVVLQLALGEMVQAAAIAALLAFNALIGIFQESRAQATLQALKSRLALVASVRRDGVWSNVPAAELVPGDVVKLSLGGVVGADVRVIAGEVLIDQSTLTGESLPIEGGPGRETYAGALIRRGEAVAEVTATGARTRFGRTAELVRTARAESSEQKAVLRVVRNLALFNGAVVVLQTVYALALGLPPAEIVALVLTAILAAIPVALPATFTLAGALGARALARLGVLPTRLTAVEEAASMDVLCADKTGTLTQNALAVTAVRAFAGFTQARLLAFAALASAEGGLDPVDAAIRAAAKNAPAGDAPALTKFTPFDPATKMAEALAADSSGHALRIVKGAFSRVSALAEPDAEASAAADEFERRGARVLAVAAGAPNALRLTGFFALSDPPREDSAALIAELAEMGVRTVMVTGDAPQTAAVTARVVGLDGAICPPGRPPETLRPEDFAVFAGVFPEDKFRIVEALQKGGRVVGMCGDGANDAPALRQAQMGIAVSSATDVAKSAAGIVLTEPGLSGIVAAVREGRVVFQRILTYTLRSLTRKISQLMFLTVGLIMTGHAVLTPMLMVLVMTTGDFLAMSSTTDNVQPSKKPDAWRIDALTVVGIALGVVTLLYSSGALAVGAFGLGFDIATLRTYSVLILVFSGEAVLYVVRERRRIWSSRPSVAFMLSSLVDVTLFATLAGKGILMAPLPASVIAGLLASALVFALALDEVKVATGRLTKTA
ncbi:MAG: HAD-IC family P-type ATPase [Roseiarcus sp.]